MHIKCYKNRIYFNLYIYKHVTYKATNRHDITLISGHWWLHNVLQQLYVYSS